MKGPRVITLFLILCAAPAAHAWELFDDATTEFARKIDTRALSLLGVQYEGRIAILDTLAREQLSNMYGEDDIDGTPPAFAYLELYSNAGHYLDKPVIYVREERMRGILTKHLQEQAVMQFDRTHRLPPGTLLNAEAREILLSAGRAEPRDFQRAQSSPLLGAVLAALNDRREFRIPIDRLSLRYSTFIALGVLRMIPGEDADWVLAEDLLGRSAGTGPPEALEGAFIALHNAWRSRDAHRVNEVIAKFDEELPKRAKAYPSLALRRAELLYNRSYKGTVVFVGFAVALLVMIAAAASRRKWIRRTGLTIFALSTGILLGGFIVRWVLSGRGWYLPPIMNQFEAVTGSALLGAVGGIVLELIWKKNYFALAASLYATAALLCGFFLPGGMSASIRAAHGILSSPIMAAHVAVIIIAHALVGMTFFISLVYLLVWGRCGVVGTGAPPSTGADLASGEGGAGALATIDRCNLIVAQLACWTLAVGTILGAYWADFAWSRFWGWDRKETWALITTLIYIVILHVRFVTPSRRRGLITALLCILGCAAMLFNWIVVNYYLSGIHSYA